MSNESGGKRQRLTDEERREYQRAYREAHRGELNRRNREYRAAHREEIKMWGGRTPRCGKVSR